jgi:hypothetical protein
MNKSASHTTNWWIWLLPILVYIDTLGNGYVLDDKGLLIDNLMTEKGLAGLNHIFASGFRATLQTPDFEFYRPLPKAIFALIWWISPANPLLPHLVNVILFAAICYLVLVFLTESLKVSHETAVAATLLFALHPIHTEVVANSKGLDELLAAFFILLALKQSLQTGNSVSNGVKIFIYMTLGMLSKESAVVFAGLLPLCMWFVNGYSFKQIVIKTSPALFSIFTVLGIRLVVLKNTSIEVNPLLNFFAGIDNPLLRIWNALYMQTVYIGKLILPYPLLSDASQMYYTAIDFISVQSLWVLLVFTLIAYLLFVGVKKKSTIAFDVLFYFISILPASNILFNTGTHYAERVLFLPSLGFCLLLAHMIITYLIKGDVIQLAGLQFRKRAAYALAVVLSLYAGFTLSRNPD